MKYHIYVLNSCCWLVYSRPIADVQYAVESSIKQSNNKAPSFFLIFCHVRHFGIPSFEKGIKMRYYIDILGKLFSQQLISLTSFSWRGAAIKEKGKNRLPLYNECLESNILI